MPVTDRDEHICNNMGLVHTCCKRFVGRGVEYDDLFQAGCMGLIKATDGFDPARGLRFSTYAVPVILGEIRRLFREGGAIKVGRTLKELSMRVAREREAFLGKQGHEPTVSELAEQMALPREQVAEALGAALPRARTSSRRARGLSDVLANPGGTPGAARPGFPAPATRTTARCRIFPPRRRKKLSPIGWRCGRC